MIALLYIFIGSLVVQLYYLLFLFSRLAFKRKSKGIESSSIPVSIVICARNEYNNLLNLLPALCNQQYSGDYEVVVVNDRSTDGTKMFLKDQTSIYANLKLVTIQDLPERLNAKKYGLTMGIKAASYDRLLFSDADCLPGKGWVQSMMNQTKEKTEFILGYSQYYKQPGFLNKFIRFETLYTAIQYLSYSLAGKPYMGVGRNLSYTKEVFLNNKGFHGHMEVTGGDDDLFVNAYATAEQTEISVGKKSIIYSEPKRTLKEYWHQKKRHLSVGKRYRFKDKVKLAVLALSQILFWASFVASVILLKEKEWILTGFLLRSVVFYLIFLRSAKILGDSVSWVWLLILDFVYVIYYITTGISAFFAKRISWNSKSNFLPKH